MRRYRTTNASAVSHAIIGAIGALSACVAWAGTNDPDLGIGIAQAAPQSAQVDDNAGRRSDLFAPVGAKDDAAAVDAVAVDAVAFSGFYSLGAAYTYAKPTHWSRAVNRLQVQGSGSLAEGVKFKIGARVDVDPVYYGSDFYLPAVKNNQKLDAIWRENYVDFAAGDWDFRIGAQQIVWGEVVGLFFADVVSARDMREFLLPRFDSIRIPQWAARAERSFGDSHLELIWIPVQTFDNIGKPGADFYPIPLPSPTPEAAAASILGIQRPSRQPGNASFGARANTLKDGYDVSVFYYRSFSSEPTFYLLRSSNDAGLVFQPRYDRIWQAGTTVTKDFDAFVLRGEAVYAHGQNFSSVDPAALEGVVGRSTLDYILSVDIPFASDARLNLQAFQRVYFGGRDALALQTGRFGVSALISAKLTRSIEAQIEWIQTFGGGGNLIRPRVNWNVDRNLSLAIGVDRFSGPSDGFFGRYNNRDRAFTEVRYDF